MGLSKLAKKCRACRFVDTCGHKQMEALEHLSEAGQIAGASAAAPALRETMEIHVGGKAVSVYKDEIERELYKHLYSHLGLRRGG